MPVDRFYGGLYRIYLIINGSTENNIKHLTFIVRNNHDTCIYYKRALDEY